MYEQSFYPPGFLRGSCGRGCPCNTYSAPQLCLYQAGRRNLNNPMHKRTKFSRHLTESWTYFKKSVLIYQHMALIYNFKISITNLHLLWHIIEFIYWDDWRTVQVIHLSLESFCFLVFCFQTTFQELFIPVEAQHQ